MFIYLALRWILKLEELHIRMNVGETEHPPASNWFRPRTLGLSEKALGRESPLSALAYASTYSASTYSWLMIVV